MKYRLVLLVGAVLLGGCARQTVLLDAPTTPSNPAVRTFDQHGISFQYPGAWLIFDPAPAGGQQGASGAPATVQPQQQSTDMVGLDELNNVQIAYGVSGLTSDDFSVWSEQARQVLAQLVAAHKEELLDGPVATTVAGIQALRYTVRRSTGLGYNIDVVWVGFIRGTTQFLVTCTSLPERVEEIQPGCQQILDTLQIG